MCPKSSEYHQIPIIRDLIDFEGNLSFLKSKNKFQELECNKLFGNCGNYILMNYNTTLNKTAFVVSLDV